MHFRLTYIWLYKFSWYHLDRIKKVDWFWLDIFMKLMPSSAEFKNLYWYGHLQMYVKNIKTIDDEFCIREDNFEIFHFVNKHSCPKLNGYVA